MSHFRNWTDLGVRNLHRKTDWEINSLYIKETKKFFHAYQVWRKKDFCVAIWLLGYDCFSGLVFDLPSTLIAWITPYESTNEIMLMTVLHHRPSILFAWLTSSASLLTVSRSQKQRCRLQTSLFLSPSSWIIPLPSSPLCLCLHPMWPTHTHIHSGCVFPRGFLHLTLPRQRQMEIYPENLAVSWRNIDTQGNTHPRTRQCHMRTRTHAQTHAHKEVLENSG